TAACELTLWSHVTHGWAPSDHERIDLPPFRQFPSQSPSRRDRPAVMTGDRVLVRDSRLVAPLATPDAFLASRASSDQAPAPAMSRKAQVRSCAYSERISCSTAQMPKTGGAGGGGSG